MTEDRQAVSAVLLVQPRPLVVALPSSQQGDQWAITDHQGRPLDLLVRGAAGRDVWIFSVTVCDETGNTNSGLSVIKVMDHPTIRPSDQSVGSEILAQPMGLKFTS